MYDLQCLFSSIHARPQPLGTREDKAIALCSRPVALVPPVLFIYMDWNDRLLFFAGTEFTPCRWRLRPAIDSGRARRTFPTWWRCVSPGDGRARSRTWGLCWTRTPEPSPSSPSACLLQPLFSSSFKCSAISLIAFLEVAVHSIREDELPSRVIGRWDRRDNG